MGKKKGETSDPVSQLDHDLLLRCAHALGITIPAGLDYEGVRAYLREALDPHRDLLIESPTRFEFQEERALREELASELGVIKTAFDERVTVQLDRIDRQAESIGRLKSAHTILVSFIGILITIGTLFGIREVWLDRAKKDELVLEAENLKARADELAADTLLNRVSYARAVRQTVIATAIAECRVIMSELTTSLPDSGLRERIYRQQHSVSELHEELVALEIDDQDSRILHALKGIYDALLEHTKLDAGQSETEHYYRSLATLRAQWDEIRLESMPHYSEANQAFLFTARAYREAAQASLYLNEFRTRKNKDKRIDRALLGKAKKETESALGEDPSFARAHTLHAIVKARYLEFDQERHFASYRRLTRAALDERDEKFTSITADLELAALLESEPKARSLTANNTASYFKSYANFLLDERVLGRSLDPGQADTRTPAPGDPVARADLLSKARELLGSAEQQAKLAYSFRPYHNVVNTTRAEIECLKLLVESLGPKDPEWAGDSQKSRDELDRILSIARPPGTEPYKGFAGESADYIMGIAPEYRHLALLNVPGWEDRLKEAFANPPRR